MINPNELENPIRVSVIIPAFNVEGFLSECLDSLYQQTLRPQEFEIIIVDDNSSDKTLKIAKDFKRKRNNVKVLHNEKNLGPGISRNKGLEIAQGDYIDPITLEQLLIVAYSNSADIVAAAFHRVDTKGDILFSKNEKGQFSSNRIRLIRNLLEFQIHHVVWNKLIKRELFTSKNIKFPKGLHEDVSLIRQLFLTAKNIVYKPDFYYYWVKREASITGSITKAHISDFLNGTVCVKDYIYDEIGKGYVRYFRDSIDIGIRVVTKILIRRITNYHNGNEKEKLTLYKYLLGYVNGNEYIREALFSQENKNDISYKFLEFFTDERLKMKEASRKLENFLIAFEKRKFQKKQRLSRKNKNPSQKQKTFIHRIIDLIKRVITHRGGIKGKYSYLVDRIIKYYYKKRISAKGKNHKEGGKSEHNGMANFKIKEDILFFCDSDYHIRNGAEIARRLEGLDLSIGIIDMTKKLNHGKRQLEDSEKEKYRDLKFYEFNNDTYKNIDLDFLEIALFFNDGGIHNKYIRECRHKNIVTVGIDEGVNDFLKLSEGFCSRLSPYRVTEHVFLPGKFETQFFADRPNQYHVVGLPMIRQLYNETPEYPNKPVVAINVNFTYGVLTNCREEYVKTAIKGCELAEVDYVITQHPMDNGVLDRYNMTDKNMYDTIRNCSVYVSRFSGSIIEALAMGKPCVYHNPHHEKVLKFQEPMGAYSKSDSAESLAKAIKYELKRSFENSVREYSRKFMEYHANIHSKKEPSELSTEAILKLMKSED